MVLDGVMTLWFVEVAVSVLFVAIDIVRTPESPVMKWGFVIVTLYTGPIGLVLYLIACREPLPGTHAEYVRPRWRQVVGSTMHCVAGDGIGILVAAAVSSMLGLPEWASLIAEYALGFVFGWTIFQSLFMRGMAGGSYSRSLRMTFLPEFVSMNGVMAGMIALSVPWRQSLGELGTPAHPEFWFVMSLALTLGFTVTYPLNWWLVSAGLKHGMTTVASKRAAAKAAAAPAMALPGGHAGMDMPMAGMSGMSGMAMPGMALPMESPREAPMGMPTAKPRSGVRTKAAMIAVSLVMLAIGVTIAGTLGSLTAR